MGQKGRGWDRTVTARESQTPRADGAGPAARSCASESFLPPVERLHGPEARSGTVFNSMQVNELVAHGELSGVDRGRPSDAGTALAH